MRTEQPRAESVERAHERRLGVARGLALPELPELPAHPLAQLARRALGEGDRQDPAGRDPVLAHRPHEPLDEHRGLTAPRPGGQQERLAAARDRLLLLIGQLARSCAPLAGDVGLRRAA